MTTSDTNNDAGADDLEAIDFPAFVSDLIRGVFNALVDSSIKQMEAYADLLKNVAIAADKFAKQTSRAVETCKRRQSS